MDLLLQWFQNNLDVVFFIYGFSFVIMGSGILIQPRKESKFGLSNILWLLAFFGITHGANEILDMWAIIKGRNPALDLIRWFVLLGSFIFAFEFGRQLFRLTGLASDGLRKRIASLLVWWLTPVICLASIILGFASSDFWRTGSIWTRYLLCFPGLLLTGFGFFSYYAQEKEALKLLRVKKYFIWAGITFLIYGLLGGLVVPKGSFFPADWLNTDSFLLTMHIPVQAFRAICAVIITVSVGGILTIFNWERTKQLQEQLIHSERMALIGQLAGGIAHDFNNLLAIIQGNAEITLMDVGRDNPIYQNLKSICSATTRAVELTRKLLIFGKKQPLKIAPLNINQTIDNLLKMISSVVPANIVIKTDQEPNIWTVRADENNIDQVLMNLTVNARDAMPNGGRLTIKTENLSIEEGRHQDVSTQGRAGEFVLISVTDTGTGMNEETIRHIFEPFFTTKEKGNGLGLSVVYGIIKQHQGWIDVSSKPGLGTTFKIYLPATAEKADKKTTKILPPIKADSGGKRILVVEDEKELREFIKMVLVKNGYTVFCAANVKEATDIFKEQNGAFQLLFSDIVMPDGNGIELAKHLVSRNKELGVLLSSGHVFDDVQWEELHKKGFHFLPKPYALADLIQTVKDAMNRSSFGDTNFIL